MSQINAGQSNGQKKITDLTYQEVLYFLSPLSDQQMNYSNKLLFKQAIKLVNEYNVNTLETNDSFSLIGYAAGLNNIKTIKYLLKRHSNDLKPQNLSDAILAAAGKGHDKALKLLLSNKKILKQAIEEHSLDLCKVVYFSATTQDYNETLRILVSNDEVINAIKSQSTSNNLKDVLTNKLKLTEDQANKIVKFSKKTFFQKMGTAITDIADGLKESGTQVMGIIKNKLSNKSEKKDTVAPAVVTTNSDPTKSDNETFNQMTEDSKNMVKQKMSIISIFNTKNTTQAKPKISLDPKTQKALQQINKKPDDTEEKDITFTSAFQGKNTAKTPGRSAGNH